MTQSLRKHQARRSRPRRLRRCGRAWLPPSSEAGSLLLQAKFACEPRHTGEKIVCSSVNLPPAAISDSASTLPFPDRRAQRQRSLASQFLGWDRVRVLTGEFMVLWRQNGGFRLNSVGMSSRSRYGKGTSPSPFCRRPYLCGISARQVMQPLVAISPGRDRSNVLEYGFGPGVERASVAIRWAKGTAPHLAAENRRFPRLCAREQVQSL